MATHSPYFCHASRTTSSTTRIEIVNPANNGIDENDTSRTTSSTTRIEISLFLGGMKSGIPSRTTSSTTRIEIKKIYRILLGLNPSRTTSSTTRIEISRSGSYAGYSEHFQNYIQHNKD